MALRSSWITFMFQGPINICRHHFYKVLVFIVFALLAAQYGLNVFVYQSGGYFSFNSSSFSTLYSNSPPAKDTSVHTNTQLLSKPSNTGTATGSAVPLSIAALLSKPRGLGSTAAATAALPLLNSTSSIRNNSNVTSLQRTQAPVLNGSGVLKNNSVSPILQTGSNTTNATAATVEARSNDSSFANSTGEPELPLCPLVPPKLVGPVKVWTDPPSLEELEKMHPELELGGRFRPKECKSRHRVAVVIPYRDREHHLRMFLHNLHPILQRQQLDYGIYVVEQKAQTKFNRAKLMNVGFAEALKLYDFQCFVFHDVDLLPEDDRNLYSCPEQPRHMSVAIDVFNYRLPYETIFGGVSALTKKQFETINGFSNQFWGWGGEDDDMANRIAYHGYHVSRYPTNIARYKMMKHKKDDPNPDRYNKLYKGKQRFKTDGLNSLKYKRLDLLLKRLYTWVHVDLQEN